MSWIHEQDGGPQATLDEETAPWSHKESDPDAWRREALAQSMANSAERVDAYDKSPQIVTHDTDSQSNPSNSGGSPGPDGINPTRVRRDASKHFNPLSTKPLTRSNVRWLYLKSILLWILIILVCIDVSYVFGLETSRGVCKIRTLWLVSYFLIFLLWVSFFRVTAASVYFGFYPFVGGWKECFFHIFLFLIGLGGIDITYLTYKNVLMRESVMQYKVLECSVLWTIFCFASMFETPWDGSGTSGMHSNVWFLLETKGLFGNVGSGVIWVNLILSLLFFILLIDSYLQYVLVYFEAMWNVEYKRWMTLRVVYASTCLKKLGFAYLPSNNNFVANFGGFCAYFGLLTILLIDMFVRSFLTLFLFENGSDEPSGWLVISGLIVLYVVYAVGLWSFALAQDQSFGGTKNQAGMRLKLIFKKTGGKFLPGLALSLWSVVGLFQVLPTIRGTSAQSGLRNQQRAQINFGSNVLRFDCFVRLVVSIFALNLNGFFNNFDSDAVVFAVMIIFAVYPYAMELFLRSIMAQLCKGGFFAVHHSDHLTSLPNIYRFNKDLVSFKWKNGIIILNLRKFTSVNFEYGYDIGNEALINFMQNLQFELENGDRANMKGCLRTPRLYRLEGDRFGLIVAFETFDHFEAYCRHLSQLKISVLRPQYIDETSRALLKEEFAKYGCDIMAGMQRCDDAQIAGKAVDADGSTLDAVDALEVTTNASGAAGGWGDSNWASEMTAADDIKNEKGDAIEIKPNKRDYGSVRSRTMTTGLRPNDGSESIDVGCRVTGSFGAFAAFAHACELEAELKKKDRGGELMSEELSLARELHAEWKG